MESWKSRLSADPTEWLLEKNNPSVRYFALHDLLKKPRTDSDVKQANQDIMRTGVVPAILAKQKKEGYWDEPERFYTAKYKGTVWQLMISWFASLISESVLGFFKRSRKAKYRTEGLFFSKSHSVGSAESRDFQDSIRKHPC